MPFFEPETPAAPLDPPASFPAPEPQPEPQAASAPALDSPILQLDRVSMRFGRNLVLRDINIAIQRGQTVCVIGESGCGKTVLLKLLIRLLAPTSGRILFDGVDLATLKSAALVKARLRYGFLFQMAALFDSMTIFDNVAFGLREHHLHDEATIAKIVLERLQEVGLPAGVEYRRPAELSGGQRKRVGLARALALNPEVMLYDEPTTGLDPIMTDVINELILQTQHSKHTTGIVVTHDMSTVRKVADRVIMFYPLARLKPEEPQILYDGPPEHMDEHPDPRVRQFVKGEAGERLRELARENVGD
jgi:phospholipid/cholesterol/gamma-HCH transport system ATP-binding protein